MGRKKTMTLGRIFCLSGLFCARLTLSQSVLNRSRKWVALLTAFSFVFLQVIPSGFSIDQISGSESTPMGEVTLEDANKRTTTEEVVIPMDPMMDTGGISVLSDAVDEPAPALDEPQVSQPSLEQPVAILPPPQIDSSVQPTPSLRELFLTELRSKLTPEDGYAVTESPVPGYPNALMITGPQQPDAGGGSDRRFSWFVFDLAEDGTVIPLNSDLNSLVDNPNFYLGPEQLEEIVFEGVKRLDEGKSDIDALVELFRISFQVQGGMDDQGATVIFSRDKENFGTYQVYFGTDNSDWVLVEPQIVQLQHAFTGCSVDFVDMGEGLSVVEITTSNQSSGRIGWLKFHIFEGDTWMVDARMGLESESFDLGLIFQSVRSVIAARGMSALDAAVAMTQLTIRDLAERDFEISWWGAPYDLDVNGRDVGELAFTLDGDSIEYKCYWDYKFSENQSLWYWGSEVLPRVSQEEMQSFLGDQFIVWPLGRDQFQVSCPFGPGNPMPEGVVISAWGEFLTGTWAPYFEPLFKAYRSLGLSDLQALRELGQITNAREYGNGLILFSKNGMEYVSREVEGINPGDPPTFEIVPADQYFEEVFQVFLADIQDDLDPAMNAAFTVSNLGDGNYQVRIDAPGYWGTPGKLAWLSFEVSAAGVKETSVKMSYVQRPNATNGYGYFRQMKAVDALNRPDPQPTQLEADARGLVAMTVLKVLDTGIPLKYFKYWKNSSGIIYKAYLASAPITLAAATPLSSPVESAPGVTALSLSSSLEAPEDELVWKSTIDYVVGDSAATIMERDEAGNVSTYEVAMPLLLEEVDGSVPLVADVPSLEEERQLVLTWVQGQYAGAMARLASDYDYVKSSLNSVLSSLRDLVARIGAGAAEWDAVRERLIAGLAAENLWISKGVHTECRYCDGGGLLSEIPGILSAATDLGSAEAALLQRLLSLEETYGVAQGDIASRLAQANAMILSATTLDELTEGQRSIEYYWYQTGEVLNYLPYDIDWQVQSLQYRYEQVWGGGQLLQQVVAELPPIWMQDLMEDFLGARPSSAESYSLNAVSMPDGSGWIDVNTPVSYMRFELTESGISAWDLIGVQDDRRDRYLSSDASMMLEGMKVMARSSAPPVELTNAQALWELAETTPFGKNVFGAIPFEKGGVQYVAYQITGENPGDPPEVHVVPASQYNGVIQLFVTDLERKLDPAMNAAFTVSNLGSGKYRIRIDAPGYWNTPGKLAWLSFEVSSAGVKETSVTMSYVQRPYATNGYGYFRQMKAVDALNRPDPQPTALQADARGLVAMTVLKVLDAGVGAEGRKTKATFWKNSSGIIYRAELFSVPILSVASTSLNGSDENSTDVSALSLTASPRVLADDDGVWKSKIDYVVGDPSATVTERDDAGNVSIYETAMSLDSTLPDADESDDGSGNAADGTSDIPVDDPFNNLTDGSSGNDSEQPPDVVDDDSPNNALDDSSDGMGDSSNDTVGGTPDPNDPALQALFGEIGVLGDGNFFLQSLDPQPDGTYLVTVSGRNTESNLRRLVFRMNMSAQILKDTIIATYERTSGDVSLDESANNSATATSVEDELVVYGSVIYDAVQVPCPGLTGGILNLYMLTQILVNDSWVEPDGTTIAYFKTFGDEYYAAQSSSGELLSAVKLTLSFQVRQRVDALFPSAAFSVVETMVVDESDPSDRIGTRFDISRLGTVGNGSLTSLSFIAYEKAQGEFPEGSLRLLAIDYQNVAGLGVDMASFMAYLAVQFNPVLGEGTDSPSLCVLSLESLSFFAGVHIDSVFTAANPLNRGGGVYWNSAISFSVQGFPYLFGGETVDLGSMQLVDMPYAVSFYSSYPVTTRNPYIQVIYSIANNERKMATCVLTEGLNENPSFSVMTPRGLPTTVQLGYGVTHDPDYLPEGVAEVMTRLEGVLGGAFDISIQEEPWTGVGRQNGDFVVTVEARAAGPGGLERFTCVVSQDGSRIDVLSATYRTSDALGILELMSEDLTVAFQPIEVTGSDVEMIFLLPKVNFTGMDELSGMPLFTLSDEWKFYEHPIPDGERVAEWMWNMFGLDWEAQTRNALAEKLDGFFDPQVNCSDQGCEMTFYENWQRDALVDEIFKIVYTRTAAGSFVATAYFNDGSGSAEGAKASLLFDALKVYSPDSSDMELLLLMSQASVGQAFSGVGAMQATSDFYWVGSEDLRGEFDADVLTGSGLPDDWGGVYLSGIRGRVDSGALVTKDDWAESINNAISSRWRAVEDYQTIRGQEDIFNVLDASTKALLEKAVQIPAVAMTLDELKQLNRRILEACYPQNIEKTHEEGKVLFSLTGKRNYITYLSMYAHGVDNPLYTDPMKQYRILTYEYSDVRTQLQEVRRAFGLGDARELSASYFKLGELDLRAIREILPFELSLLGIGTSELEGLSNVDRERRIVEGLNSLLNSDLFAGAAGDFFRSFVDARWAELDALAWRSWFPSAELSISDWSSNQSLVEYRRLSKLKAIFDAYDVSGEGLSALARIQLNRAILDHIFSFLLTQNRSPQIFISDEWGLSRVELQFNDALPGQLSQLDFSGTWFDAYYSEDYQEWMLGVDFYWAEIFNVVGFDEIGDFYCPLLDYEAGQLNYGSILWRAVEALYPELSQVEALLVLSQITVTKIESGEIYFERAGERYRGFVEMTEAGARIGVEREDIRSNRQEVLAQLERLMRIYYWGAQIQTEITGYPNRVRIVTTEDLGRINVLEFDISDDGVISLPAAAFGKGVPEGLDSALLFSALTQMDPGMDFFETIVQFLGVEIVDLNTTPDHIYFRRAGILYHAYDDEGWPRVVRVYDAETVVLAALVDRLASVYGDSLVVSNAGIEGRPYAVTIASPDAAGGHFSWVTVDLHEDGSLEILDSVVSYLCDSYGVCGPTHVDSWMLLPALRGLDGGISEMDVIVEMFRITVLRRLFTDGAPIMYFTRDAEEPYEYKCYVPPWGMYPVVDEPAAVELARKFSAKGITFQRVNEINEDIWLFRVDIPEEYPYWSVSHLTWLTFSMRRDEGYEEAIVSLQGSLGVDLELMFEGIQLAYGISDIDALVLMAQKGAWQFEYGRELYLMRDGVGDGEFKIWRDEVYGVQVRQVIDHAALYAWAAQMESRFGGSFFVGVPLPVGDIVNISFPFDGTTLPPFMRGLTVELSNWGDGVLSVHGGSLPDPMLLFQGMRILFGGNGLEIFDAMSQVTIADMSGDGIYFEWNGAFWHCYRDMFGNVFVNNEYHPWFQTFLDELKTYFPESDGYVFNPQFLGNATYSLSLELWNFETGSYHYFSFTVDITGILSTSFYLYDANRSVSALFSGDSFDYLLNAIETKASVEFLPALVLMSKLKYKAPKCWDQFGNAYIKIDASSSGMDLSSDRWKVSGSGSELIAPWMETALQFIWPRIGKYYRDNAPYLDQRISVTQTEPDVYSVYISPISGSSPEGFLESLSFKVSPSGIDVSSLQATYAGRYDLPRYTNKVDGVSYSGAQAVFAYIRYRDANLQNYSNPPLVLTQLQKDLRAAMPMTVLNMISLGSANDYAGSASKVYTNKEKTTFYYDSYFKVEVTSTSGWYTSVAGAALLSPVNVAMAVFSAATGIGAPQDTVGTKVVSAEAPQTLDAGGTSSEAAQEKAATVSSEVSSVPVAEENKALEPDVAVQTPTVESNENVALLEAAAQPYLSPEGSAALEIPYAIVKEREEALSAENSPVGVPEVPILDGDAVAVTPSLPASSNIAFSLRDEDAVVPKVEEYYEPLVAAALPAIPYSIVKERDESLDEASSLSAVSAVVLDATPVLSSDINETFPVFAFEEGNLLFSSLLEEVTK